MKEKPWRLALQQKTPQLDSSIDTFISLIYSIDQPQGVYKIRTTLFSISLPIVRWICVQKCQNCSFCDKSIKLGTVIVHGQSIDFQFGATSENRYLALQHIIYRPAGIFTEF